MAEEARWSPPLDLNLLWLTDCLIQVRDQYDTETSLFWLRQYLNEPWAPRAPGIAYSRIDHDRLNYNWFEEDLIEHFGYDRRFDEIAWEPTRHMSAPNAHRDTFSRPLTDNYSVVHDFRSWVDALLIMGDASSNSFSIASGCPVNMIVYFTIVHHEHDSDYVESSGSDSDSNAEDDG
ncbi:uncharacterized protein N7515_004474 [Penicillium bovifimosum]|uniref:Uncharacterized protein n=1 Tax=Penicillium bovifimosum TaxID=126998 RepID=A0A9W9L3I7_9EURO|nr:uncharacterized protein N7515_004474 [Penicillium bovifimosum]KAJ5135196.1 hypothetical protein N7515_004474 [Penicillium bovifimosum]